MIDVVFVANRVWTQSANEFLFHAQRLYVVVIVGALSVPQSRAPIPNRSAFTFRVSTVPNSRPSYGFCGMHSGVLAHFSVPSLPILGVVALKINFQLRLVGITIMLVLSLFCFGLVAPVRGLPFAFETISVPIAPGRMTSEANWIPCCH